MRPGEIPAAGLHAIAGVFLPLLIPLSWSGRPGEGVTYAVGCSSTDHGKEPGGYDGERGILARV